MSPQRSGAANDEISGAPARGPRADLRAAVPAAQQVVREVDKGNSGMVWAGGNAGLVGWAWYLSPQFVKVSRYFCLSQLSSCANRLQDMMVQSFVPVAAEMAKASNQKTT